MQRIANYLYTWRLRLSTAKTTCTEFHLNNRKSSRELAVTVDGTITQKPTYLGVTLDRQLALRQNLEGVCCKVRACDCKGAARGGAEGAQAPPLTIRILMFIFLVFHQHYTVSRDQVHCKMFFGSTTGVATHSLSNQAVMNLRFEKY